jgi:hypothetical protein
MGKQMTLQLCRPTMMQPVLLLWLLLPHQLWPPVLGMQQQ